MKRIILGCSVLALVVMTSSGFFAPKDALAKVGKHYITQSDVQSRLELEAPGNAEAQSNTQNRTLVLDQLINESILLQAAKKEGYTRNEAYKSQVEIAKKQILIGQLAADKITPKSQVTAKEVKAFFDQNKDRFGPFESRKLSHIQVDTKTEANAILRQLRKKGANFAAIAKKKSKHPSATNGGDIGVYQKSDLTGDFEALGKAAFKISRKGRRTGVVKSPLGYHIVKVTDIIRRPALKLEDVQQDIFNALVTEKRRQATASLINEMKEIISVKKLEQS